MEKIREGEWDNKKAIVFAKEFLKEKELPGTYHHFIVDFLQSMIDKGEVVDREKYNEINTLFETVKKLFIELLEKYDDLKQSTVSSAGKEVKTAKRVLQEFWEADDVSQFDDDMYNSKIVVHIMELYASQFKSPPTLKIAEVSDQEIESAGYADCGDKTNHRFTSADQIEPWIEGAKWYREQLNK